MKQKERLAICSNCTRRKLDFEHGLVCGLTGSLADFKKDCKDFERDEAVSDTIKVRTKERPWMPLFDPVPPREGKKKSGKSKKKAKSKAPTELALKKLRRYQSFLYALFGGLLFSVLCSLAWTELTYSTGYQGAYMALGVGLLVGLAVRFFGAGIYRIFGVLAALLTLLASLLGYYLSQTGFLVELRLAGIMKVLDYFNPDMMLNTIRDAFVPFDLLFYGLAVLLSYLLAIRRIGARKREKLERDDYKGAPVLYWIRLPLILAGILLPAYYVYTQASQDSGGVKTLYYESGEKMSEGEMRKGSETGNWIYWYENGNMKSKGNFSDGLRDSLWQWYDESANHTRTGMYLHGAENGSWINYYTDGVVSDSGAYLEGLKEGLWKSNYENGRLKSTLFYKAGKMHGEKTLFTPSGTIVRVQRFENGALIESPQTP
jgi:hypothetical protein